MISKPNSFSERLGLETGASTKYQGLFCDREQGNWWHDYYIVTIKGQPFEWRRGIGYRTYKKSIGALKGRKPTCLTDRFKNPGDAAVGERYNDETTAPSSFPVDEVIAGCLLDSDACEMSFEDWCDVYGYSTDSRKALDCYLSCQKNAHKIREVLSLLGVGIDEAREKFSDY